MSETTQAGLPAAAQKLGVSVRLLRRAMRAGALPPLPGTTATVALPAAWLAEAQAAVEASPGLLHRQARQAVPSFARYRGTSAWRKYRVRVREYEAFRAATAHAPA